MLVFLTVETNVTHTLQCQQSDTAYKHVEGISSTSFARRAKRQAKMFECVDICNITGTHTFKRFTRNL